MGAIKVILSDELEEKFRSEVFKSKGMKKGNITIAIEEAISMWIETQKTKRRQQKKHGKQEKTKITENRVRSKTTYKVKTQNINLLFFKWMEECFQE